MNTFIKYILKYCKKGLLLTENKEYIGLAQNSRVLTAIFSDIHKIDMGNIYLCPLSNNFCPYTNRNKYSLYQLCDRE